MSLILNEEKVTTYSFYNDEVKLEYYVQGTNHGYRLDGKPVPGVTTVCHIIDKSNALIPWAAKMVADKLLDTVTPEYFAQTEWSYDLFKGLVLTAKGAHKDKIEEAADIGRQAHDWIEKHIEGRIASQKNPELINSLGLPENEKVKSCYLAALKWMGEHNVRWICTERKIYSKCFNYAGTLDAVGIVDSCTNPYCTGCLNQTFKDRLSIIDWKSSNYLYNEYLYQTAAYLQAYCEETGAEITDRWIIRLGKEDGEFDPWHFDGQGELDLHFQTFVAALNLYNKVEEVNELMVEHKEKLKAVKKLEGIAIKQKQLKLKCKGADKYKGIRYPRCNSGNPCKSCLDKYEANHAPE